MKSKWSVKCQEVAASALDDNLNELPIGLLFPEIKCAYYSRPGAGGKSVLACSDGEFLESDNSIPVSLHLEAFKSGLRTSRNPQIKTL